jgi:polysaccharide deacetylase 2 family uncharacterized protein YibQ
MRNLLKAWMWMPLAALWLGGAAHPTLPRIALVVAGIGYAEAPDLAAIKELPAAVTLALSPYGAHLGMDVQAAQAAKHELIMGIPMQPRDNPVTSEGNKALLPDDARAINKSRLDWVLAQAKGYDGTADVIGIADNSAYMNRSDDVKWLGGELAARHLFFIELRGGKPLPGVSERPATTVIMPDQGKTAVKQELSQLAAQARAQATAIGVVIEPAPATIPLLALWCNQIQSQGITLVPVHDLMEKLPAPAAKP